MFRRCGLAHAATIARASAGTVRTYASMTSSPSLIGWVGKGEGERRMRQMAVGVTAGIGAWGASSLFVTTPPQAEEQRRVERWAD
jgi:hypothetical protein